LRDCFAITTCPILLVLVYSRMDAKAAGADLHIRMRHLGESMQGDQPLTICLFLDGENAWEYYPGNGRAFLREFYGRIQGDQDFRALTATEAIAAAGEIPRHHWNFSRIVDQTRISTCGSATPRTSPRGELLWDAREAYARAFRSAQAGKGGCPNETALKEARESAGWLREGSDWVLVVRPGAQHRERRGV